MSDYIAWAKRGSVAEVIHTLNWDESTAYMYLERVPLTFLPEVDRQSGLQLRGYASDTWFDHWERGRVFNAQQEMRWEQRGEEFHAVYCGPEPPSGFAREALPAERKAVAYYLWGRLVREEDRDGLGIAPQIPAFIDLQIPRILLYPMAPTQGERLRVGLYEYYAAGGSLCYARWYGLH